ncbi:MAG: FtsX-like permease family protein [Bacteroidota bacterium]|nr:FtsX-like permease family protein [Bacteroidota bacterium]
MIWSIAGRNIWRKKIRSSVVIAAVAIGILAGSFAVAIMNGMAKSRTETLIKNESAHIQIHHPEFSANRDPEFVIKNKSLAKELESMNAVVGYTERLKIDGMATSNSGANTMAMVNGINPEQEKRVSEIYKHLNDTSGNYLESDFRNPIVIGEEFAKTLKFNRYKITQKTFDYLKSKNVPENIISEIKSLEGSRFRRLQPFLDSLSNRIGKKKLEKHEYVLKKSALYFKSNGKVIITLIDNTGQQTQAVFRVCGIFKTNNTLFDGRNVFVKNKDLQRISGYNAEFPHETAILLNDRSKVKKISQRLSKKYPELAVTSWKESNPEVAMLSEYIDIYNYIIVGLILGALAFGIVNTMLMAIMERTKELGMLAAIGMNKKRRFNMIMTETIWLTLSGAIIGMFLNLLIMTILGDTGINLSKEIGEGTGAMGHSAVLYPVMYVKNYIGITVMVILTAVLSSIYPAVKALRLNPANALRSDA